MKKLLFLFSLFTLTAQAQVIETVSGNGTKGYNRNNNGGQATSAELFYPSEATPDGNGNIYISDQSSSMIRKVNTSGIITVVAGLASAIYTGYSGDGGQATAAELYNPTAVAFDASHNYYIADYNNYVIRKVSYPSNIITTVAGNNAASVNAAANLKPVYSGDGGPATAAELNTPWDVVIDKTGNLYIADATNNLIRVVTTNGIISTFAGNFSLGGGYSGDGGPATGAELDNPTGIAVDGSGNVYIADQYNSVIRLVNTSGNISTYAGNYNLGGNYSGDGGPATDAGLSLETGVFLDASSNVYIVDDGNNVIREVNKNTGIITTVVGDTAHGGTFYGDGGLATAAGLNSPTFASYDALGDLYIGDTYNNRIRAVFPCTFTTQAISSGESCFGNTNAQATAINSGGFAPYTYSWSNGASVVSTSNPTNKNLSLGTYTVTVQDVGGCSATASVVITQPSILLVLTSSSPTCFGISTGMASASVSGGTAPYTYLWSNKASSSSLVSLSAGNYSVTVTDANSCSATASVSITQPASALSAIGIVISNESCNGGNNGSTSANTSGGSSPYTYSWNTTPIQTSQQASGLTAGVFIINVSDNHGCTASASVSITQPPPQIATISALSNVTCNGLSNGSATVFFSGGSSPYTYSWNTIPNQTIKQSTGLSAGNYLVTIYDNHGCTASASVTITQPSIVTSASSVLNNVLCGSSNGSATINVSGGTSPYSYFWTTKPSQTNQTATGMTAGNYTITVTDANGCITSNSAIISQPSSISVTISINNNVSCNGGSNGNATANVSSGISPYTYTWNTIPIQTNQQVMGMSAGSYTVVVTDNNNCIATASVTISQPFKLTTTAIINSNILCNGGSTGSATANLSGGTSPYLYAWNSTPIQTSQQVIGIPAGSYTVTVSDNNNCTATTSVTLTQPTALSVIAFVNFNVSCNAGSNGSASASITGGVLPYTYSWNTSPIQTNQQATGVVAGSYTLTVTDNQNCTSTASISITQPTQLIVIATVNTNIFCFGGSNGSASVSASGGVSPYTYSWNTSPVQTSQLAAGVTAGTYIVTVSDNYGCTTTASATITQPLAITISVTINTNVYCNGESNGSATVNTSGGILPYTYSWNTSPAQTNQQVTGAPAGNYIVMLTDNYGCAATASVSITQPSTLSVFTSVNSNVSCSGGSSGIATVNSTGGTLPFTYLWNTLPAQTTQQATGMSAGSFIVTLTDNNGCSASSSVIITQPTLLSVLAAVNTNVSCGGGSNGSAIATPSGGVLPYTYSWNTSPLKTTSQATGISAGSYIITVIDNNGCVSTASITLTQPSALIISTTINSNVSCNGESNGSATANASGGISPYTYLWSTSPLQTNLQASGIAAGNFTVTMTDNNGCIATASITITQPSLLSIVTSINANISCFGESNGSVTANPSGGTSPYTYLWNTNPFQTSQQATGIDAGSYTINVSDSHGCSSTAFVNLKQPQALSIISFFNTNISCSGGSNGSSTPTISGGTSPYSYSWNTNPIQINQQATGLSAGNFTVTITDNNGCLLTASTSITQPPALVVTALVTSNLSCNGGSNGSAVVNASGGVIPYTYSWNTLPIQTNQQATNLNAGSFSVTVTDNHGCTIQTSVVITQPSVFSVTAAINTNISCNDGSNGSIIAITSGGTSPFTYSWNTSPRQTSQLATGVSAGSYAVTLTDNHGCIASASVTITQPTQLLLTAVVNNEVSCNGGSNGNAGVNVSGGATPYTYSWSTFPRQTSQQATGMSAGSYNITVTDNNGCTSSATTTVTQPVLLTTGAFISINVSCYGGSNGIIIASVSGGVSPYSYEWNTSPVQTNQQATGLTIGNYMVTIIDNNGCTLTASAVITQPSLLTALAAVNNNVLCGSSNGSATATASGGILPYTYKWNTNPMQSNQQATGLSAGNYIVTINDNYGCNATASVLISQPSNIAAAIKVETDISCNGGSNGSAIVNASGGAIPYSYSWNTSPIQTNQQATGMFAGNYTVIVTDNNGCAVTVLAVITQPSVITPDAIISATITCYGTSNGSASVSVSGGTSPFTYSWNTIPIQTNKQATGLSAGSYLINITDNNGCTASSSITISQPPILAVSVTVTTNVSCYGESNGSANAIASGGISPYTYTWFTLPHQSGQQATGMSAGNYNLIVTDINGCTVAYGTTITQPSALSVTTSVINNISCNGSSNGGASANPSGGTSPYTYSWNTVPVQTSRQASGMSAGIYTVMVTDNNYCSDAIPIVITEPSVLSASASVNTNVSCNGGSNGSATANPSGGTAPYSYSWNTIPVQTNQQAANISAGSYTVTVTDNRGCVITTSVIIIQPTAIGITASVINNVLCGGSNGSATVTASGGNSPYTYSWSTSPAQTNLIATGMTAGGYIVTVTDANGCSSTASTNISEPTSLIVTAAVTSNISCYGGSNGSAIVTASGGTSPYTYSWETTPVQTDAQATLLNAGNYKVIVTDNGSCTSTAFVIITQPFTLTASISIVSNVTCNGYSTGNAEVTVAGGSLPYSYLWDGGQTTSAISGLIAGGYTVTITDDNGCTMSSAVTITQPLILVAATSVTGSLACNGNSNGSAISSVSGGTLPYSYMWSNGDTRSSISSLTAGNYKLTVVDSNGCTSTTAVSLTQPIALSITTDSTVAQGCNGAAWVNVAGGTLPYTYLWTKGQTTDSISNQCPGNYCCVVTDFNGCIDSACVTVTHFVGIEGINNYGNDIDVYPNPNRGEFDVIWSTVNSRWSVEVDNVLGEKMITLDNKSSENAMHINIVDLPQGVYLLKIISEDGTTLKLRKIIKQ